MVIPICNGICDRYLNLKMGFHPLHCAFTYCMGFYFSYLLNRPSFHLVLTEVQYFFWKSTDEYEKKTEIQESFVKHHDAYKK